MRIYAACLAAYNSGHLHGAWLDVSSDADEMQEAIAAMLRASPCPNVTVACPDCDGRNPDNPCATCGGSHEVASAEEWAIHDYDDFPNMGEYPGLDAVAEMAGLIETAKDDHGIEYDDFKAIAANWHGVASDIEHALEAFAGIYDTLRDYADELADDRLDSEGIKEGSFARMHFDYESHARDIEIEYTVIDCPAGVAVFWPH
jgi:antirestriction protein